MFSNMRNSIPSGRRKSVAEVNAEKRHQRISRASAHAAKYAYPPQPDATPENKFIGNFAAMRARHEDTDFMIYCQGSKWDVHRLVLKAQSLIWSQLLNQDLKHSTAMALDSDFITIELTIHYLYTFNFDIWLPSHNAAHALHLLARIYSLASTYQINGLPELCIAKCTAILVNDKDQDWVDDILDFLDAVEETWKGTPSANRGLRKVMLEAMERERARCQRQLKFRKLVAEADCQRAMEVGKLGRWRWGGSWKIKETLKRLALSRSA